MVQVSGVSQYVPLMKEGEKKTMTLPQFYVMQSNRNERQQRTASPILANGNGHFRLSPRGLPLPRPAGGPTRAGEDVDLLAVMSSPGFGHFGLCLVHMCA
jgi:hypothetical protein